MQLVPLDLVVCYQKLKKKINPWWDFMCARSLGLREVSIVTDLAERMQDPDSVKSIAIHEGNRNPNFPFHVPWKDLALAHGYPSMVLFYSYLDQYNPELRWDIVVENYIKEIMASIEQEGIKNFSLFEGLAGVCYAITIASQKKKKYSDLLKKLHELLISSIQTHFNVLHNDITKGKPSSSFYYDHVQGGLGIGFYLLTQSDDPYLRPYLQVFMQLMIKRMEPILFEGFEVPGWYIPFEYQLHDQDKQNYPRGNFNLGLVHGVTGILALLSIAMLKGIDLPGQKEAILRIANWIKSKAVQEDGCLFWPEKVKWEDEIQQSTSELSMQHSDWCYGKPGILRSLYLAGKAVKNDNLLAYAHHHFKHVFLLNDDEWNLQGPAFCHGLLGLYAMSHHMAKDTRDIQLYEESQILKQRIMDMYNSSYPFGFQEIVSAELDQEYKADRHVNINKVGFLDGSVGIALALLDSYFNLENSWDAPFLISTL